MFLVPLRRAITQSNLSAAKHPLHNCTVLKGLILRSQAGQSSTISGSEASSHAAGPSHSFTSEAGGSRGPAHQSSHTSADASTGPGSANSNSGRGFGGPADGLHRSRGFPSAAAETVRRSHQERGYASKPGPKRGSGPRKGGGTPPRFTGSPGQPKRKVPPEGTMKLAAAFKLADKANSAAGGTREAVGLLPRAAGVPAGGSPKKLRYPQPQNAPAVPWTPTSKLKKRKTLPKRMGFMLQELEKEKEVEAMRLKNYPSFGSGAVLEVGLVVPENKGRPATFKGICIARRNRGYRTSFTMRNHMGNVGAVERTFPLYSPTIQSIKVLDQRRVRRAKLYYLRERNPKEYRVA